MNFEKSLVFLTSNLGAKEMLREINPDFGFQSATVSGTRDDLTQKLQGIALAGVFQILISDAGRRTLEGQTQDQIADELMPAIEAILDDLDRWLAPSKS